MKSVYDMLDDQNKSSTPRLSKEEYVAKMKEKRAFLFDMANKQVEVAVQSPTDYINYLSLQGRLGYTVTNTLLIQAQMPYATEVKDVTKWREENVLVKNGGTGIQILEPGNTYTRRDGSSGTSYNPKYVFDITQVEKQPVNKVVNYRDVLSAVIYKQDIKPEVVEYGSTLPRPVYYDATSDKIYVQKEQDQNDMIAGLIHEYCYIQMKDQFSNRNEAEFTVASVSLMLCERYGIQTKDTNFIQDVTSHFAGMDAQTIKGELNNMKKVFDQMNSQMEHGLYMKQKSNNQNKGYR